MAKPDDEGDVPAPAASGAPIDKPKADSDYLQRLYAIARQRPIRGITTDEFMKELRGDPAEDPPLKA